MRRPPALTPPDSAMLLAPVLLSAVIGPPAAASPPQTPTVLFDGRHHKVTKLPDAIEDDPREAIQEWAGWAEDQGYSMALTDDQRLLFLAADKARIGKRLKTIHEAQELTDVLLFGPDGERPARRVAVPERGEASQQDPGGTTAGAFPPPDSLLELGTGVAIIFELDEELHMLQVLERIAHEHDHVKEWLDVATQHSGFTFEHPLVGAWRPVPENEEWDPEAELVNRVAQLLLTREYGPMPYWLGMGLAWNVEYRMLDGIWCYPYRAGFVWATEHTAWPKDLKKAFMDRPDYPLQPDELASWTPRTYDAEAAPRAFGMVHFLAEHHPEDLPALLSAYHDAWSAGSVVVADDGTWKRTKDYVLPEEQQVELLVEGTRADLFEQVSKYFAKSLRYKPR